MKLKKILSICLVGAMAATMLAACGSSDETVGEEIKDDAEEVVEDVKDDVEEVAEDVKDVAEDVGEGVKDAVEDVGEDVKDAAEEAVDDVKANLGAVSEYSFGGFEQTITIKGYGITTGNSAGLQEVVDAINAISIPTINVEVDYEQLDMGAYSEQIGLMFAGGESFDFTLATPVTSTATGFAEMYASGELLDISPYVDEYASETMELLGDYADPYWIDGGLYGLPAYRIYNANCYIVMRKDILDYLGLTEQAEAISSWSDFEEILATVYDAQEDLPEEYQTTSMINRCQNPNMVLPYHGFDNAADDFSEHYGFDYLGDDNHMIKVEDGQITCFYESQDYVDIINRVRNWYLNDWVYKDAANDIEDVYSEMAAGAVFCCIDHSEVGVESAKKMSTGYDVVCVNCCSQPIQTAALINVAYVVPVTSQEPEAAVAFLNLMYTNAEIENLLVYGIEGRDYYLNDDGEAVFYEDCQYMSSDFLYGNQFLAYPSDGEGSDFREYSLEVMMDDELSPYYGFIMDLSDVENENAAVSAVIDQYAPGLNTGVTDASETYDEFIDSLYAAGLQILMDAYQEQLDAFLAEQ